MIIALKFNGTVTIPAQIVQESRKLQTVRPIMSKNTYKTYHLEYGKHTCVHSRNKLYNIY